MSNRSKGYAKAKGRAPVGSFLAFPHAIGHSANYRKLTPYAKALLLEIALLYNGSNNGDLSMPFSYVHDEAGWRTSKSTFMRTRKELEWYGLVVVTQRGYRQAGRKPRPTLYALSWLEIQVMPKASSGYQFAEPTEWRIGDIPGAWKIERPIFVAGDKKREPPKKKNAPVRGEYQTGTSLVLTHTRFQQK